MTPREQLIEKAAKAMFYSTTNYLRGSAEWEEADGSQRDRWRTRGGAALAVFEEANTPTDKVISARDLPTIEGHPPYHHYMLAENTPTDDEREAMRRIIAQGSYSRSPQDLPYADVADRLAAAGVGFHRTVQGEPSEDMRGDAEVRWPIPVNYQPGDVEHTLLIAQRQAYVLGRLDEGDRTMQGEPFDVRALLDEAEALVASWDRKGSWSPDSPVGMVMQLAAALRAAAATEGGERHAG